MARAHVGDSTALGILHEEDNGGEDAGDGGAGQDGGPDDAVRGGEVVEHLGRGLSAQRNGGDVEDTAGPLIGLEEGHGPKGGPLHDPGPLVRIKGGASLMKALGTGHDGVRARTDTGVKLGT